jgi:hypothetical protein
MEVTMLKYDPPTATTTPVRQVTGLGFASDLPAASPPPSPSVTDCAALLRLAQAAADRVEGSVGDLDGTLCEFAADDVPNQIWDAAANASTVLEIASANILAAIEDLAAQVGTVRANADTLNLPRAG